MSLTSYKLLHLLRALLRLRTLRRLRTLWRWQNLLVVCGLMLSVLPAFSNISTTVTLGSRYYPQDIQDSETYSFEQNVHLLLNYNENFNHNFRFVASPFVFHNFSSDSRLEQIWVDTDETYLQWRQHPVTFRIGWNHFRYGKLDGFSPMNVVLQQSYRDPLQSKDLAAPSVLIRWESLSSNFDFFFIPRQRQARFPGEDSRWLPREILLNYSTDIGKVILPDNLTYYYLSKEELDHALSNNVGIAFETRQDNFDINALYFRGAAHNPEIGIKTSLHTITGQTDLIADELIGLRPIYYLTETTGANVIWASMLFLLRLETAYINTLSDNEALTPWSWRSGIALEKTIAVGAQSLTVVWEGYYAKHGKTTNNLFSSSQRIFDEATALGVRMALSSSRSLMLTNLYDLNIAGSYWRLSYSDKVFDQIGIEFAVDLIDAPEESLLGTYNKNDRYSLNLTGYF